MKRIYGYARISTRKQSIERQIRNIKREYPDAIIYQEAFTGTKVEGRKEFNRLLKNAKKDDTIIFDSVSRMSRNADDGFNIYMRLFNSGIDLVFLKEPYINTETYKKTLENKIKPTGTNVDIILEAVNQYLLELAKEQIKIAFDQSEKEVKDIRQRTKEGIETARRNGKQIGGKTGKKLVVKKAKTAKEIIYKHSKDFTGTLSDKEVIKLADISRNTYYKYKKDIKEHGIIS